MSKISYQPITDEALACIEHQTAERDEIEPRVAVARYEPSSRRLMLELRDGTILGIPVQRLSGLKASDEQIAAVKVVANGSALHWEDLDVQMTTLSVIHDAFGVLATMENLRDEAAIQVAA